MNTQITLNALARGLKTAWMTTVLSAVILGAPFVYADAPVEKPIAMNELQQTSLGVLFSDLTPATQQLSYSYSGEVDLPPAHLNMISVPVDGIITKIFEVHGPIEAGQPIVEIQSAKLLQLQEMFLATLSERHVASAELKRSKSLVSAGAVSQKQLLEVQSRLQMLTQQLDQQKQDLAIMGMAAEAIKFLQSSGKLQPATLVVKAPLSGELFDFSKGMGASVQQGEVLAYLGELDQLMVDVSVPIEEAQKLKVGQKLQLKKLSLIGEIGYIRHSVDPLTQMVQIHCRFDNPNSVLRPGALVKVEFVYPLAPQANAYLVPTQAVTEMDGQSVVFLRDETKPAQLIMQAVQRIDQPEQQTLIVTAQPIDVKTYKVASQGIAAILAAMSAGEGE